MKALHAATHYITLGLTLKHIVTQCNTLQHTMEALHTTL